jgi:hypothetical protein
MNAQDLIKLIDQKAEEIATLTDKARITEEIQDYFKFCARFHKYSFGNIISIMLSKPDASHVAGYNAWLKMHRFVKKGEKGIPILAPCPRLTTTEEGEKKQTSIFFKVVYVFDVSQTEGEPLPEAPNPYNWEKLPELNAALVKFAKAKGITITEEIISNGAKGSSAGGKITLDPSTGTITLIHEIAHEILHQKNRHDSSREDKEIEAETTAYIVAAALGYNAEGSANYLALWDADSKKIAARLGNIQKAANEILTALLPQAE